MPNDFAAEPLRRYEALDYTKNVEKPKPDAGQGLKALLFWLSQRLRSAMHTGNCAYSGFWHSWYTHMLRVHTLALGHNSGVAVGATGAEAATTAGRPSARTGLAGTAAGFSGTADVTLDGTGLD